MHALILKSSLALATAALLLTLAPEAFAKGGHGNGHGRGNAYGHRRGCDVAYAPYCAAPRQVAYAPVYAAPPCAPRYVVYRPQRVLVVQPTPYIQVGTHIGPVDISAVFGPNRYASRYEYGCNFCDAHFSSFGAYENHVEHCGYAPSNVHIEVHAWGDNGYGQVAYDGR